MKLQQPKIKQLDTDNFENCVKNESWYGKRIEQSPINEVLIENVILDCCHFYKVDFSSIRFSGVDIVDCVFEECLFMGLEIENRAMQRTIFKKCNMMGTNIFDCGMKDVQFIECQAKYINFSGGFFKSGIIKNCAMAEGRWHNMELSEVILENSDFRGLEVNKTKLRGIDFSASNIEGIMVEPELLRGSKLNMGQALELIGLFGIEIV